MGNPPLLSLRVAFVFSLSVTAAYSYTTSHAAISSRPKATTKDLLTLLGPSKQASSINAQVAEELKSCFKFLVPFSPPTQTQNQPTPSRRFLRQSIELISRSGKEEELNELIWWPPAPVMELSRLAVDSGGDPGAIDWALDPSTIQVPDVEGSKEVRCELTRTPYGRRFINEELNSYLEILFKIIVARGPSIGLNVSLNRYDLFHGHIFLAVDSGRLGILFHAKEYPAYEKDVFPYNMGYCQRGSNVAYDNSMNFRNILWLAPLPCNSTEAWLAPGVLVVLDAHPGGIIYQDLIPEYVHVARTLYEDDFGEVVADVNYLNVGAKVPRYQIFIC